MALPPGPTRSLEEAQVILSAPGSLFETERVVVNGRVLHSFKNLPRSLRSFWLTAVTTHASKPYVVYEGKQYTYLELHERAVYLANVFYRRYSIRKGDRVAITLRNCHEWIISFWACHLLGAISTLVNAWLPVQPLLHCLNTSEARLIIIDPERALLLTPHISSLNPGMHILLANPGGTNTAATLHPSICLFDDVINQYIGPVEAWRSEPECALDDPATLFFTSGTTGLPKGVLSSHRSFMHTFMINGYSRDRNLLRMGFPPAGRPSPEATRSIMLGVPLFHVTGAASGLMGSTWAGFKVVLLRKWDKERAADIARAEKVNIFSGVPSMVIDILESSLAGDQSMLQVSYGGAPAASTLPGLVKRNFPNATLTQGYGLTETNGGIVSVQGADLLNHPGSTGICAPVNELRIVSTTTGKILSIGESGELWVRGPSVMLGYWNNPAETEKAVTKNGWFKTGDIAYMDEAGFVYICDRVKDMIIRGGENISSVSVENAIYADERVYDVAVVGIPDRRLGELVGALVVPKPGIFESVTEADILARCKTSLPHFAIPAVVVLQRDPIERNAAGKIVKTEVRKTLANFWENRGKDLHLSKL